MTSKGKTTPNDSHFCSTIDKIYDSILTLVYPTECRICHNSIEHQADGVACSDCWQNTPVFNGNETLCHKCGAFLVGTPSNSQAFCRRCDDDFYDRASAIGRYEKALLAAILSLKHTPFVPKTLSDLLFKTFLRFGFHDTTLVVPVPLSRERLASRGFNQAEILAERLAKQAGLPVDRTSLRRKTNNEKSRRGMDRKSRQNSVKNAFEVVSPRLIEGQNVLLIDDVFTSGATASDSARALKKAGAEKVFVLTVARA